jgi:maltooligosyltrehalose trehalohydrolase
VATAIEQGFLFQGQQRPATKERRGTRVTDEPARAFVFCSENHDQVGNRALGERLAHLIDRERYLVASAVLLFVPETILLFQGQEYAATAPFQFFTDHNPELGRLVTEGRRKEFAAFGAFADEARRAQIPDPQDEQTYRRSILDHAERESNEDVYGLYHALLRARRTDPVLRHQDRQATRARALSEDVLAIRRWHDGSERVLVANFGDAPAAVDEAAQQALAIERADGWRVLWSTPIASDRAQSSDGPSALADRMVPPRSALLLARDL